MTFNLLTGIVCAPKSVNISILHLALSFSALARYIVWNFKGELKISQKIAEDYAFL